MNLLRRLFRKRLEKRAGKRWEPFVFPGIFNSPGSVTVYGGTDLAAAWAGLFMACSLQKHYRGASHALILHESLADMAGTLPWEPSVHTWSDSPARVTPPVPTGTLLFSGVQSSPGLAEMVLEFCPALSVAPLGCPVSNVQVRVQTDRYPGKVHGLCEALGIPPDRRWIPTVPQSLMETASGILAPVSHRTLPYILASSQTADILERRRAEIPLRLVIADGRNRDIPENLSQSLLMALVAGSCAVLTDREDLWVHANALGVPVVGYDRKNTFPPWGCPPARGETELLEEWGGLLRKGW